MNLYLALDRYVGVIEDALGCLTTKLNKSFKTAFISTLVLYMVLPRKVNFTQMGRYSDSCEQRFRQLHEKEVDWMAMNVHLADRLFDETDLKAIALDPSFQLKAGWKTPDIGMYWSGCAGAPRHGLEILGIGVISVQSHDCAMLRAVQTPGKEERERLGVDLSQWYLQTMQKYSAQLLGITDISVADSWFAKEPFVNGITALGFRFVSRLQSNSALYYAYMGKRTGKPGRPKVKDGKVDVDNLDDSKVTKVELGDIEGEAYEFIAYKPSMKRKLKIVIFIPKEGRRRIYFSTDTEMAGADIVRIYKTRFQEEFCYRDAKQFTGLGNCQARNSRKLDFAFNASFMAVNIAKVMRNEYYSELSIGLLKAFLSDVYKLKRIFSMSEIDPDQQLITKLVKELFGFVADAA